MTGIQRNKRPARRPDRVTEMRIGNTIPVVSGSFREGATDTTADKTMKVLGAEAAAGYLTCDRPDRKTVIFTDRKEADLTLLPLYGQLPHVVQSKYGIVGLVVGNGGIYVKIDHPTTHYRPSPKTAP